MYSRNSKLVCKLATLIGFWLCILPCLSNKLRSTLHTSHDNLLNESSIRCDGFQLTTTEWPQEKLKTTLMQNLVVTNKEHYGMLWYFL